ncbi:hypothetical protein [Chryseobacterium sp.]|uniref:hypothetical protein n=1 Tax=Chryseobacterium sp. TaxID=1871047 RepID=UPI00388EA8D6
MKGYIEDGAWISCTFDLVGTPQQLQRHLDSEDNKVQYSVGKRLLTELDKNTKNCFKCKSPAKFWGGMLAFVGGVAVGAALVLSGPVGWIALGAIAAVAIGTTIAVITHDCSDKQKAGSWENTHQTVLIKKSKPLLYNYSILTCKEGGLMIASETEVQAQKVSDSMKYNVRQELAVQILSQAVYGVATGATSANPGVAAFNAVAGAGIYAVGESNTPLGITLSGMKLYGPDKWIGLIASSNKNILGAAFAKDFFMGRSGFLAGAGVTVITAVADYFVNKFEETLINKNENIVNNISEFESSSNKVIISKNY